MNLVAFECVFIDISSNHWLDHQKNWEHHQTN